MIYYNKQHIDKNDIKIVNKVLTSSRLTQGPMVENFQKKLKFFFGSKYALCTSNGTAALHLAGIALGWKKNDIIIASPITFVASVNCAKYLNARIELVDIDENTFNIDVNLLEKKLKKLRKVHTVIATDYAGFPCDWLKLKKLSRKYKFRLLNDNCHALGSTYNNSTRYACKYADIVTQSYHPVKNFTTAEGGAVLTNSKKYFDKIKHLISHGIERNKNKYWMYDIKNLGYNYRLSEVHSALGVSQIKKLNKFVIRRQKIAKIYDSFFKDENYFKILKNSKKSKSSYHLYTLVINFKKFKITKDIFIKILNRKKIFPQVHYKPIHKLSLYSSIKGKFKNSEKFYDSAISLPLYYNLVENKCEYVASTIIKTLKQFKI